MFRDVLRVVARRKWLVIIPFVVVFAIPTALTLTLGRSYVSEGAIQVVPNSVIGPIVAPLARTDGKARQPVDDLLDEAKTVLASRTYLTEIAVRAGAGAELKARPDATLARFRNSTDVFSSGPELLMTRFKAATPEAAQRGAQAELDTILNERVQRTTSDAQAATKFFGAQVDTFQANLKAATDALQTFEDAHPEAALSDTQKSIVTQLSILRAQLAQVRVEESNGQGDPAQLKAEEANFLQQITQLSIPIGATADVQLELLRLTDQRQAAQSAFGQAVQQDNNTKLLAAVSEQEAAQDKVLDKASLPSQASKGKAFTLAALALVVAAAAAASLVLLAEYLDVRVRRPEDVVESGGIPVLAVVERAKSA